MAPRLGSRLGGSTARLQVATLYVPKKDLLGLQNYQDNNCCFGIS